MTVILRRFVALGSISSLWLPSVLVFPVRVVAEDRG